MAEQPEGQPQKYQFPEQESLTKIFRSWDSFDATTESTTCSDEKRTDCPVPLVLILLAVVAGVASVATWYIDNQLRRPQIVPPDFSSLQHIEECNVQPIQQFEFVSRMRKMKNRILESLPTDKEYLYAFIAEAGTSLQYFVDIRLRQDERPLLLILSRFDLVKILCPAHELDWIKNQLSSTFSDLIPVVAYEDHEDPYEKVANEILDSDGQDPLYIYLDPELRSFVLTGFVDTLGGRVSNATFALAVDHLNWIRGTKSKSEVNLLRCANIAVKEAFHLVQKMVVPGMTEMEVSILLEHALRAANLTNTDVTVLFGNRSASTFDLSPSYEILEPNGVVYVNMKASHVTGYKAGLRRTFVPSTRYSTMPEEVCDIWKVVRAAQLLAIEQMGVGVMCSDVEMATHEYLEKYNLTGELRQRIAHGIGLNSHEEPYVTMSSEDAFQENMTLCVSTAVYFPAEYGIVVGDVGRVTANGFDVFGEIVGDNSCDE